MSKISPRDSILRVHLIQDPVHGSMQLLPCQLELLNTPHFQRLTRLKQLGTCHKVYPGATHTRAEHSLGVAWLTRVLLRCLRANQKELEISERDERLLVLAAQSHDLGHGIASHAYEGWLHSLGPEHAEWSHEQQSVRILRHAYEHGLLPCLKDDENGLRRIEAFIVGKQPNQVRSSILPRKHRWMLDVVNNARNGIDVDKLDYLSRDAHHALGSVETGLLNVQRILENMRVSPDCERICFHVKMVDTLYELFHRRWSMFRAVYQHGTAVAVELMLQQALNRLFASRFFPLLRSAVLSRSVDEYLLLDDSILSQAIAVRRTLSPEQRKEDVALQQACEIRNQIESRNLYRLVLRQTFPDSMWRRFLSAHSDALTCNDWLPVGCDKQKFFVHWCRFHYGAGDRDPLKHVYFFDWKSPDEPHTIATRQYMRMLPRHWSEVVVRVYSTERCSPNDLERVVGAFATFVEKNTVVVADGEEVIAHQKKRKLDCIDEK